MTTLNSQMWFRAAEVIPLPANVLNGDTIVLPLIPVRAATSLRARWR